MCFFKTTKFLIPTAVLTLIGTLLRTPEVYHPISDELARLTKTQMANDLALWGSFQPLYDLILEIDPSFLD